MEQINGSDHMPTTFPKMLLESRARKLDFTKYDKFGQKLTPGNVCVRLIKDKFNRTIEFCVYKGEVRGSKSKGTFGRFITPSGARSLKYSSVVFVFDNASKVMAKTEEVQKIVKEYYEG